MVAAGSMGAGVAIRNGMRARRPDGWCGALLRWAQWALLFVFVTALVIAQTPPKQKPAPKTPSILPAAPASAQPATTVASPEPPPPDPLGRGNPHGCVLGFLKAAESGNFVDAAKYLDTKKPEAESEELARELKTLLDKGTKTDLNTLSRVPDGDLTDNMRTSRERVGVVPTPSGPLDVLLDRVERPNQQAIWLFSRETLRQVPERYASTQAEAKRDIASYFPAWMSRFVVLGYPLWRWVLMVAGLGAVLVLASLFTRLVLWLLRLAFRKRLTQAMESMVLSLRGPIFGLMAAVVERVFGGYSLTVLARHRWEQLAIVTALLSGAWLVVRLTDIVVSYARHQFTMRMEIERVTFVGLLGRMFKILIAIIIGITLLTMAGVDVTALVTGLGIGGIALALAAQKTLSDLFGGISVVMRGAVRVGDFCTIGTKQGTVEEIGISSLRMRTLDRTVVTIPNSKVAEADLENFTMRDQFWVHQVFTLRFDTPYSVVAKVLSGMVEVLKGRPDVNPDSARARVINLTNTGPQVEVFAYYRKPGTDYAAFLGEQEQIILAMMRLVEEAGTAMVAPMGLIELKGAGVGPDGVAERAMVHER